jgi:hypothetical protein
MNQPIQVQHRQGGAVSIEGAEVVVRLSGTGRTRFLGPKEPWEHTYRVPLARAGVAFEEGRFLTVYDGTAAVQQVVVEPGPALDALMAAVGERPDVGESGSPQVAVKTYRNAGEYERDAPGMASRGWIPAGQSTGQGRVAIGRTAAKAVLTGGIGLVLMGRSRSDAPITVTWVKG